MSAREYRSADKGQSWKLDLAMAIDEAMCCAVSREHFIELMEMEGYKVNWSNTRKYITYTCPNGMKCRDNKLHEEKYLKGAMTDEFRIRQKITERIEGSGKNELSAGSSNRNLRFDYGEELAGADTITTDADKYAEYDYGYDRDTGNVERTLGDATGADGKVDRPSRGDQTNADRVPADAPTASEANPRTDLGFNDELPITGWEYERRIFEEALLGRGADQEHTEETNSIFDYPDDTLDHLGIDSAYLAADVINVIDNDSHTEDCATNKKPRHEHKNTLRGLKM
jgi:hypothetical protein